RSHPERDLGRRYAALARDLRYAVDDVEILRPAVPLVLERVGLRAPRSTLALARPRPREEATGQRTPRDDLVTLVHALRDHLPLLFAVGQVVVELSCDDELVTGEGREVNPQG